MKSLIPKATDKTAPMRRFSQHHQDPQQQQEQQAGYTAPGSRVYATEPDPRISLPAGRIVDDSSRGILFWEVDDTRQAAAAAKPGRSKSASEASTQPHFSSESTTYADADTENSNNWTIPFQVEWLSPPNKTVPFAKVRTLRNAYNKNKFLKIARDGTEIEPSVGRKLVELFHT